MTERDLTFIGWISVGFAILISAIPVTAKVIPRDTVSVLSFDGQSGKAKFTFVFRSTGKLVAIMDDPRNIPIGFIISHSVDNGLWQSRATSQSWAQVIKSLGDPPQYTRQQWPKIPFWAGSILFLIGGVLTLAALAHGDSIIFLLGVALCAIAITSTSPPNFGHRLDVLEYRETDVLLS